MENLDNKVLISVVLPTYNGSKRISKAIESVLLQSMKDWELIIIDDGSTDDTEKTVKEFCLRDSRIIYIKNEQNLGLQKTLNKGIKIAKGKHIARIDDDDVWIDENKLKEQVEFLEKNSEYVLVGTGVVVVNEEGEQVYKYLNPEKDEEIKNKILWKNPFAHSSVMFTKKDFDIVGGYNEDASSKNVEDYDLWLSLGTVGKFHNLQTYSLKFMAREGSITTKNRKNQLKKNIQLAKKYKKLYPNYFISLLKSYFRLWLFNIYTKIPQRVKYLIIRVYKKY